MQADNRELYDGVMNFEVSAEVDDFSFYDRLARENNWGIKYSQRCFSEYKKFIYLASISQVKVTPSDDVDQVWHLHLTYTKSYWKEFCGKVLGKEVHHNPTKGGVIESVKYRQQYEATLKEYEKVFEEVPATDIWPTTDKRFKNADKFVRLNKAEFWVVSKKFDPTIPLLWLSLIFLASLDTEGAADFWIFIKLAIGGCLFIMLVLWLIRKLLAKDGAGGRSSCDASGCSGCGGCGG